MIHNSEGALHDGQPIHCAITRSVRRSGAATSMTPARHMGLKGITHPAATACSNSAEGIQPSPS